MPRADHYFVEFEFWSAADQLYWLPLFIHAGSLPDAETYAAPIKAGLLANYQVLRESRVALVTSGLTSDTIAEYRKSCATRRPRTPQHESLDGEVDPRGAPR